MKKNLENSMKKWFFSLICIMAVTYISSYILVVIPALKRATREKHKQDINKLFSVTSQQFDHLSSILKDNAEWDTLYQSMDGSMGREEKQKFWEGLFTEDSLKLFGLDYIAIYDNKQNEVVNYSFPETNIKNVISLKGKKYFFSSQPNGENRVKTVSGYMDIAGKAYIFFSHVILDSNGNGKAAGHLLFIQEIDDDYIFDLKIKNNLSLQLYIPNENDKKLIQNILDSKKELDFYSDKIEGGKRVYYLPYMKSVHKIAYIIKVTVDDRISKGALLNFWIGMIPIILSFLFIFFVKNRVNKKLITPLVSLYSHITSIRENQKYKLLEYPEVGNEMDEVIRAFNNLMVQTEEQKNDIEDKKIALEKLAYTDYLTGLSTRRFLDEGYDLLFKSAKRSGSILTLIMMDIDYFKKYNDRYGHPEGDRVLKIIGKLLKKVFKREGDIAGRYGGEEFLIILYQTPLEETICLINEFQKKLEMCNLEHKDSNFGQVTVSMGIKSSTIPKDQNSYLFLKEADKALYKAKESGRNRYILQS
ncbi:MULTISPECIES: sensor domain-containing diguanylate cyclase [Psychrilyobacter]|uniref:Diguanylate cyclase n=1 Tax=Psychrilyobacter piezotolerans TaxID=2293438 RepID=A0ABX9KF96_9FUSO|nr:MULTISPECIES: diguanylate cyclase [Psychrilyobacter]MCS5420894.1 diguanylate cyclase [Psychrilyobacter sp. S5]NDI78545.1 diguanylate cyclase [Psychrilyobacter piezotolerans]RDE60448.1 diguanylate cyclase [Psychrilyobacter sp. S5]REI40478.1 diguanylate cyclase [Psychrilyobacter piezotolerans]